MLRHLICMAMVGALPTPSAAQTFNNISVVSLHQAGLGEATIVTKINSLPCGYDVSTDGLISLKKAGLTDNIIAAMVSRCIASTRAQGIDNQSPDPLVKHTPGIYMLQDWVTPARLAILRPVIGGGNRTTGIGSIVFPMKSMLVIPQAQSQNQSNKMQPKFYFYFDVADKNVSDFGTERSRAAQSPSEFSLIKFRQRNNSREIEVGRMSTYITSNIQKGVKAKDTYTFSAIEVGDGIFEVSVSYDLDPGEYAFIFSGETGRSRVYDFSIPGLPASAGKR